MNVLREKYSKEIEALLAKYPEDEKRSAVMPIIYLAQRADGHVTKQAMKEIAQIVGISPTEVASVVGFYTLYNVQPGGKYRIQVCNDLSCAMRGADGFLTQLSKKLGIQVGETTPDGLITLEGVMCLAACDKAPMFQVQTGEGITYYDNQTIESTMELIDGWRKQEKEGK